MFVMKISKLFQTAEDPLLSHSCANSTFSGWYEGQRNDRQLGLLFRFLFIVTGWCLRGQIGFSSAP